jgi:hypothetical protein
LADEARKSLLFLKKKKQKDFRPFAWDAGRGAEGKSFLVLFSKKEQLPCRRPSLAP